MFCGMRVREHKRLEDGVDVGLKDSSRCVG